MYKYRIARFQNIPRYEFSNQQYFDQKTLEKIRQEQNDRNYRLKLGLSGLVGAGALAKGGYLFNKARKNYNNLIGSIADSDMYPESHALALIGYSRKNAIQQVLGASLGLAGISLLGNTTRRIIKKIHDKENQLTARNNQQN